MKTGLFCLFLAACGGPPFTLESSNLGNSDAGELERETLPKSDAGAELDALGNVDGAELDASLPKDAAGDARALEAAAGPVMVGGACDLSPWQANECESACQRALQGHGSCPEGFCVCR